MAKVNTSHITPISDHRKDFHLCAAPGTTAVLCGADRYGDPIRVTMPNMRGNVSPVCGKCNHLAKLAK